MDNTKQIVKGNGNTVNFNKGLGVEDVYRLALKMFTDNFPRLQQEAFDMVQSRIDEFLQSVAKGFASKNIESFDSFKNPDMQYVLYDAMKSYARYGTDDLLDLLTALIVDRADVNDDIKLKIAIDDAIQMAPKMTNFLLNYLTMVFLCKQVKVEGIKNESDLISFFNQTAVAFPFDHRDSDYLNSIGCFIIDLDSPFDRLSKIYSIDKSKFDKTIPSFIDKLPSDYSLSFPAIVLAIVNARCKKTGLDFDLKNWIK